MSDEALAHLGRAEEVVRELTTEINHFLRAERTQANIPLLASEAVRLVLRSLDELASELAGAGARFPVCDDARAFVAATRPMRLTERKRAFLEGQQPYVDAGNAWLARLAELHRTEVRVKAKALKDGPRVTVRSADGSGEVVYNSAVAFGPGVKICGAAIDPETGLPEPTAGVTVEVQRWGSMRFADGGEDIPTFLTAAIRRTRAMISSAAAL